MRPLIWIGAIAALTSACTKDRAADAIIEGFEALGELADRFPTDPDYAALEGLATSIQLRAPLFFETETVTRDGLTVTTPHHFPRHADRLCTPVTKDLAAVDDRWAELDLAGHDRPGHEVCYRSSASGDRFAARVSGRIEDTGDAVTFCVRGWTEGTSPKVAEPTRGRPDVPCPLDP